MKLAAQVLMIAATAGLAALAVTTRKPADTEAPTEPTATVEAESDAWFI